MDAATINKLKAICKNMSVLYAEDDGNVRAQMCRYLERFFSDITTVPDGAEGVAAFRQRPFDIVITDIQMPNMDGVEMIRAIKAIRGDQAIIVTSSHNESDMLMKFIDLGVDRFVLKPIDVNHLMVALLKMAAQIYNAKRAEALERQLQHESKKNVEILDRIQHAIVVTDHAKVLNVNRKACDVFHFDAAFRGDFTIASKLLEPELRDLDNEAFLEHLHAHPALKVSIEEPGTAKSRHYIASCYDLSFEGESVITFADISSVESELQSLRHMLDVDETTMFGNRRALTKRIADVQNGFGVYALTGLTITNLEQFKRYFGVASFPRIYAELARFLKSAAYRIDEEEIRGFYAVADNVFVILHDVTRSGELDAMVQACRKHRYSCRHKGVAESAPYAVKSLTRPLSGETAQAAIEAMIDGCAVFHE